MTATIERYATEYEVKAGQDLAVLAAELGIEGNGKRAAARSMDAVADAIDLIRSGKQIKRKDERDLFIAAIDTLMQAHYENLVALHKSNVRIRQLGNPHNSNRHNAEWSSDEDDALISLVCDRGLSPNDPLLAVAMGRTSNAIQTRLSTLTGKRRA